MEALLQDLRYAVRALARSPLLVLVTVASLGLGIGANTTIFSLVNALLLRPMPARHPEELALVYTSESTGERFGGSSYPDYLDFRDRNSAFESLAAFTVAPVSITVDGRSQLVLSGLCSGNYFGMLGTGAALGRTLLPTDDVTGTAPVAMMSHGLWTRRFGADPRVVGSTVRVNGHAFNVVGILRSDFRSATMGVTPDLFVPLATLSLSHPGNDRLDHRGGRWLFVVGRLAPGRTVEAAQARMDVIASQLAAEYPEPDSGRKVTVVPEAQGRLHPRIKGPVTAFMTLLLTVVGLVLVVACANVAGLLLARATSRRREVGVRLALGASRGRIVAQFLVESLLLALLGGAAGWLLASWGTDLLLVFKPPLPIDVTLDVRPDSRVLVFTLLLSLATGVLFGLVPALEAVRVDPGPAIHDGPAGSRRRSRLRASLVVGQVAISLLLLVGAGLLLRGLDRATRLDPGFDVDHTVAMSFDLKLHGYDESQGQAFYRDLLERVRALPQVRNAAVGEHLPLGLGSQTTVIAVQGHTPGPRENLEIANDVVSAGYFATMGIPIVRGREFRESDRAGGTRVAIVSEAFARRFWPGQDPLGKRLTEDSRGQGDWVEVVGVARDVKFRSLSEAPPPFYYQPFSQVYGPGMTLVANVTGVPARVLPLFREVARTLDPDLPIFEVKTLVEHLGITLFPARLASSVLASLGLLALLLAAIGLYGVVAFGVTQRTREIGVRMALGAAPRDVLQLVVGQGMRLALIGLALGFAAALAVTRLVASLLFGLSPTDPITLGGIAALLLLVTLLASWLPARRAARVDPMVTLRHE